MKSYHLFFTVFILAFTTIWSQDAKFITETFEVKGNCNMCKERIENSVDLVGVKRASWDEKNQLFTLTFNPSKITLQEVHRAIAKAGHATSKEKADQKAYNNLHHCCKYVEHNHDGLKH